MANARKCDRCGKFFDPLDQMARFRIPGCRNNAYVDLCHECTAEFTLFMEGVPLAVRENDFDKPDIPEKTPDFVNKVKQKSEFEEECDILKKIKKICDDIWAGDPSEMPSYKSSTREEHRL